MEIGARDNQPGYLALTIDGKTYALPRAFKVDDPIIQTAFQAANGAGSVDSLYAGNGLPNVCDRFSFELPYDTDDTVPALARDIETLRSSGTAHRLAYWKQRPYTYTAAVGQEILWLPRADAFGADYPEFADPGNMAQVTVNGGDPLTVVYHDLVAEDAAPAAGEIWISKTSVPHPFNGRRMPRCKVGAAFNQGDVVVVRFFPLFLVRVTAAPTEFPGAGQEMKTLYLVEVN